MINLVDWTLTAHQSLCRILFNSYLKSFFKGGNQKIATVELVMLSEVVTIRWMTCTRYL